MLYEHQRSIVAEDKKHALLAIGTGGGKTIIALSLAEGETLVVCPKTVREDEIWQKNLAKLGKSLSLTVISKEDFRLGKFTEKKYDTLILDEVHQIAGATPNIRWRKGKPEPKTSQIFDKVMTFIEKYPPKRLYGLSATPTRSPMCVWGIAKILGANWNFYEFRDAFYFKIKKGFHEIFIPKKDKETKERLGRAVRKLGYTGKITDYVDMPKEIVKIDYLGATKEQRERFKELITEHPDPLVGNLKKHQLENGVLIGDEYNEDEVFKNEKLEKILDYASEFPYMVIFARYTLQIKEIARVLKAEGYNVSTLEGDTKNRKEVIENFNNSKEAVLIVQSTISAGWEIPECPVMIFASLDFSIVSYIQAKGRINRINNPKRNIYIHLVVKGGVDEHVYKTVVVSKQDFHLAIYKDAVVK